MSSMVLPPNLTAEELALKETYEKLRNGVGLNLIFPRLKILLLSFRLLEVQYLIKVAQYLAQTHSRTDSWEIAI